MKVRIDDVQYIKELYPRLEVDDETVKRYRTAIDNLPPILISNDYILIDGYHRLVAHQVEGRDYIEAEFLNVGKDKVLIESAKRNATHGKQLTYEEKKRLARRMYEENHDNLTQEDIGEILAVSNTTVSKWCSDINDKKRKEKREKATKLYLDYLNYPTQEGVAKALNIRQPTIANYIKSLRNQIYNNAPPDSLQLYNVWKFHQCDPQYGMEYPGRIPGQVIENLVYYYTEPFDLVVDPMAGGGTTVDVCKAMYRRYAAFDVNPIEEKSINKRNTIEDGIPLPDTCSSLVFIDPPYWNLMDEHYHSQSISNLSYNEWLEALNKLGKEAHRVLKKGGVCALLIMASEDETGDKKFRDAPLDSANLFRDYFDIIQRVSVPLSTEVKSARDVNFAKENKKILSINRDLILFKK